jgi:hypothetical protein
VPAADLTALIAAITKPATRGSAQPPSHNFESRETREVTIAEGRHELDGSEKIRGSDARRSMVLG